MSTATADRLDPRLVARAQRIVDRTGKVPSQRALMDQLKIGRDRAKDVLAALADAPDTATSDAPTSAPEVPLADAVQPHSADAVERAPETRPEPAPSAPTAADPAALPDAVDEPTESHPAGPDPALDERTPTATAITVSPQVSTPADAPAKRTPDAAARTHPLRWPLLILCAPAFVAIWAGWVALGRMTGFGRVDLLPGIGPGWVVDTAITLPVGVETYAAYALWVWLSGRGPKRARRFARWSAIGALALGAAGQIAYHLMAAAGITTAPWQITTVVACLPVAVLGAGAALAHLMHAPEEQP